MVGKKPLGCTRMLVMVLLAIGSFVGTYNLITLIIHNRTFNSLREGVSVIDPVIEMPQNAKITEDGKMLFHIALTATDAPYSKWQCRIMYYWYKKQKDLLGSHMGKFTRILHSGKSDNLMDEIPTYVVDPLPSGLDRVRKLYYYYYFCCFGCTLLVHVVKCGVYCANIFQSFFLFLNICIPIM